MNTSPTASRSRWLRVSAVPLCNAARLASTFSSGRAFPHYGGASNSRRVVPCAHRSTPWPRPAIHSDDMAAIECSVGGLPAEGPAVASLARRAVASPARGRRPFAWSDPVAGTLCELPVEPDMLSRSFHLTRYITCLLQGTLHSVASTLISASRDIRPPRQDKEGEPSNARQGHGKERSERWGRALRKRVLRNLCRSVLINGRRR